MVRIAAIGDLHAHCDSRGHIRPLFASINHDADVLVLAGDLTLSGDAAEARVLVEEISDVRIPVVVILGNHDYDLGQEQDIMSVVREAGYCMLDGESVVLEHEGESIGIVGTKGFCGGFDKYLVAPFGEGPLKDFVHAGQREVEKLEQLLSVMQADYRVVLLHYAPVRYTLEGESPELFPFLGNSLLAKPIDQFGADLVLHAHAHYGKMKGHTKTGIPVFNVARTVVKSVFIHHLEKTDEQERRSA